jgi:glycosyltransferase involved in cell wall biosynthesis
MKHRPLVSIIINNYNYGHFLREAIDSALNQIHTHTEVIVVDDGSTDNSRELITSYGNRIIPVLKRMGDRLQRLTQGSQSVREKLSAFLTPMISFCLRKWRRLWMCLKSTLIVVGVFIP